MSYNLARRSFLFKPPPPFHFLNRSLHKMQFILNLHCSLFKKTKTTSFICIDVRIIVLQELCNYPRVFRRKKGDYVLPFVVRPSVCPSGRQQFTSISSYTIDARITKPKGMIPLYIQMVATHLKFFYIFQF